MKKLGFLVAAAFLLLISQPALSAVIDLQISDTDILVGDSFELAVMVDGEDIGEELLAFGFDVSILGGSYFTYDGYDVGSGFDDFSAGFNNVAGVAFPGIIEDDVLIATLHFTAIAEGTDIVEIFGPGGGGFSGLVYEFSLFEILEQTTITVNDAGTAVPEPATCLLFGIGLMGLCRSRRAFV